MLGLAIVVECTHGNALRKHPFLSVLTFKFSRDISPALSETKAHYYLINSESQGAP
jgi:hypothetical protein